MGEQGLAGGGGVRGFQVAEHRLGDRAVGLGVQDADDVGVAGDPQRGDVAGSAGQGRDPRRGEAGKIVVGDGLAAERGEAAGEVVAAPRAGRRGDVVLELEALQQPARGARMDLQGRGEFRGRQRPEGEALQRRTVRIVA